MDNYPVDMDECMKTGMMGLCGKGCRIFQAGECEFQDEVASDNSEDE